MFWLRKVSLGLLLMLPAFPFALALNTEDELKLHLAENQRQLSATQSQLAAAEKEKAALTATVARLTVESKAAAHSSDANAADIRYTQNVNDEAARRERRDARDAAAQLAAKQDAANAAIRQHEMEADAQARSIILAAWAGFGAALLAFLGTAINIMFGPIWKAHIDDRDRKWREIDEANQQRNEVLLSAVEQSHETVKESLKESIERTGRLANQMDDVSTQLAEMHEDITLLKHPQPQPQPQPPTRQSMRGAA